MHDVGQPKAWRDWKLRGDLEKTVHRLVLQEIATSNERPDLLLWTETQYVVYCMDLAAPWEDAIEMAYEWKLLNYVRCHTDITWCQKGHATH